MTWKITSRTDPSRWLESTHGIEFTADPQTTSALGDLTAHSVSVYPGGPTKEGVDTPAELLTAARTIIPDPQATGDLPKQESWPTLDGLLVY